MNAVVQFDASVPAFLRNAGFLALNQKAAAGLSTGAPPRLSFRGSRFRLVSADGTETPVNDIMTIQGPQGPQQIQSNGTMIDVIVLDASDHVSKFYYDKAYDPNADDLSPACFSDNGVGPSVRASKPQSLLCQGCPKNAWGSKVTPQGSQIKACSDVKKLAILPTSNVDGPAYMLGIPGASLKAWTAAVTAVSQRGIPIPAMVWRIGFDPDPAFPKLTFTPVRWLTEQEAASVSDLFGSDECAELVGRKDTPIQALPALQGTPAVPVAQQAVHVPVAPVAASTPPPPVFTQPTPEAPPAFLQQPAAAPAAPAQDAAPRRRRGRPPAAETAPAAPAAPQAATPFPAAPSAPATPAAPAGAPDLNALLDQVMAKK